jgi:diacylglycerol kinase family enzyme
MRRVIHHYCREVDFVMAVSADGELVTHTPANFTVCKAAIKVFVPLAYLAPLSETHHVDT